MGARCCAPSSSTLQKRLEQERYVKSRETSVFNREGGGTYSPGEFRDLGSSRRDLRADTSSRNGYSAVGQSRNFERLAHDGRTLVRGKESQQALRTHSTGYEANGDYNQNHFYRESSYRQSTKRIVEYENESWEEEERRRRLEGWMTAQPLSMRRLERSDREVAMLADERDNIQKKTFTKWVNKHLLKAGVKVDDLFVDLRDGNRLISLLEVLTGERLSRENGFTRFHKIQNVQYCLDFLKKKNIKLVNIRPEDIIEGNSKLTLGLIWTIILNFQVSVIKQRQKEHEAAVRIVSSRSGHQVTLLCFYPSQHCFSSLVECIKRTFSEIFFF